MAVPIKADSNTSAYGGSALGAYDGARYLESLRDGRNEIWYRGERVKDVTTHPELRGIAESIARIYDMQHDPETRDQMTYTEENGLRCSYSYSLPHSVEDLQMRRKNTEIWVDEVYGMCGRLPDFCASMAVGYYDLRHELSQLDPDLGKNAANYYYYARDNDLCISHSLHDPCMDKSLRPSQDPDRCVRVVKERDDGIIVRGARFNTFGLFSNEIFVMPTYRFIEGEEEFALWFTVPCNAPGLKQIARESFANRGTLDHPVSSRFDEIDSLVIFDDVFIPWERVLLYRQVAAANNLRGGTMSWASYAGTTLTQTRMKLLISVAHLLAATSGMGKRANVVEILGEMCTYYRLLRSSFLYSELQASPSKYGGLYQSEPEPARRAMVTMISEKYIELVEHIGTSSLIFLPTEEDWNQPEIKQHLEVYLRGKDTSSFDRHKICKLAWDLTGDGFGSRQQLYERLHSGDPAMMVSRAYMTMDLSDGVAMVEKLLDLETPAGKPKQ
jgi:4-hydroxyphenylacetate 3-monooxygenase oxygenase component